MRIYACRDDSGKKHVFKGRVRKRGGRWEMDTNGCSLSVFNVPDDIWANVPPGRSLECLLPEAVVATVSRSPVMSWYTTVSLRSFVAWYPIAWMPLSYCWIAATSSLMPSS